MHNIPGCVQLRTQSPLVQSYCYSLSLSLSLSLTLSLTFFLILQNIESGISSHAASVASLTAAGEKLITSSSAENTAEIQHDLSDLNEQ